MFSHVRISALATALALAATGSLAPSTTTAQQPTPSPSASPSVPSTPVSLCGTLVDYRAPSGTNVGSVIVGEEHFFVSPGAQINVPSGIQPGTSVCLTGRWIAHAAGRNLTQLTLVAQPSASASPLTVTAHENAVLGYRIGLPQGYRRYVANAGPDGGGADLYTKRVGDVCARSLDMESDVQVEVLRTSLTPVEFAGAPDRRIVFTSIQPLTLNGRVAARVVHDGTGDSAVYVISANARLYVIQPAIGLQPSRQPTGWLDAIARSFEPLQPSPPASQQTSSPCIASLPSTSTLAERR